MKTEEKFNVAALRKAQVNGVDLGYADVEPGQIASDLAEVWMVLPALLDAAEERDVWRNKAEHRESALKRERDEAVTERDRLKAALAAEAVAVNSLQDQLAVAEVEGQTVDRLNEQVRRDNVALKQAILANCHGCLDGAPMGTGDQHPETHQLGAGRTLLCSNTPLMRAAIKGHREQEVDA